MLWVGGGVEGQKLVECFKADPRDLNTSLGQCPFVQLGNWIKSMDHVDSSSLLG